MAERNIDSAMWEDPKVLRLTPQARALLAYLVTSSRSHAMGIYRLPMYVIDREHGFSRPTYLEAMTELSENGIAHYDIEREVVWVVNMAKRQARSPVVWRRLRKHLEGLYESPLIASFVARYLETSFDTSKGEFRPVSSDMATLAEPLPKGIETLAQWLRKGIGTLAEPLQPLPNPSSPGPGTGPGEESESSAPSSYPETHTQNPPASRNPKPSAPPRFDFEAIYKIYPRKVGKKAGLAKLAKVIRTEADYTHLLDQVRKMADLWRAGDKTYCPHFATWVNQERWRDDELPGPVRRDSRGRAEPPPPKLLRLLP